MPLADPHRFVSNDDRGLTFFLACEGKVVGGVQSR